MQNRKLLWPRLRDIRSMGGTAEAPKPPLEWLCNSLQPLHNLPGTGPTWNPSTFQAVLQLIIQAKGLRQGL